ncbi:GlxA family transcriptional regulator [Umezawaea tangerina]|uniref:AraC family transcriptional regulator with amidase-like domain n=1 Tax=Umezawaea tangerina TaxID=84725 RepID=A0A2T0SQC8_9PSEU|nr:helix-turn-helix domain-containing protein [Umezawaea tangerina]PRY35619.1 AraC family transcriptional regulator with amidase-like domain [Umezawaea tangerina]
MHRVVVLVLEGVVLLDFGAAAQFFGHRHRDPEPQHYEFRVCSPDGLPVTSGCGVPIGAHGGLELLDEADTVIVPGYELIADPLPDGAAVALNRAAAGGARMVSICTGAFALGHSGLLDGHKATTHWAVTDQLQRLFPAVGVVDNVLYVADGQVLTSGGVAAGIDLCLHIVREDFGADVATKVARRTLVAPHRSGDQAQFVEHATPAATSVDMAALLNWLDERLDQPLSVADMAEHIGYSTRSFGRHFQAQVGTSPWKWVAKRRVVRAQQLLETTDLTVEQIAQRCGFESTVAFRRRFRELVHLAPTDYRRAFRGTAARR